MPNRRPLEIPALHRTRLLEASVLAVMLFCLGASAEEPAKQTPPPVTMALGQKMLFLPLLPESEARSEYPLTMRAEADEHGLYLVFDLEGMVLSELSRTGSPFYIDLHFDLRNEAERTTATRATRFRIVGRFDEGQMAVERTVSDAKGENLKTKTKLDAEARLSFLRSGTPRVSLFMSREEIGDHPWKIGEKGQFLPFDVFVHLADFDRSGVLELVDEGESVDGSAKEELTAEPSEPGQQVYPDWHTFVMVRGLNDPQAQTIPTGALNSLQLHKFSLKDLTLSLRAIGQASAKDDITRRSNSVALMTILDAEVRGGVLMAREHRDDSVRQGAEWVIESHAFGGVDGGVSAQSGGLNTAGK